MTNEQVAATLLLEKALQLEQCEAALAEATELIRDAVDAVTVTSRDDGSHFCEACAEWLGDGCAEDCYTKPLRTWLEKRGEA